MPSFGVIFLGRKDCVLCFAPSRSDHQDYICSKRSVLTSIFSALRVIHPGSIFQNCRQEKNISAIVNTSTLLGEQNKLQNICCTFFQSYLDLPRGAEWMIRGAYLPSLRVQTAPFGRCWYANLDMGFLFLCRHQSQGSREIDFSEHRILDEGEIKGVIERR